MSKVVEKTQNSRRPYLHLLAKSINSFMSKDPSLLGEDVSLVVAKSLRDISFKGCKDTVVLHFTSGGRIPSRIGLWELKDSLIGSRITMGVYKKHR